MHPTSIIYRLIWVKYICSLEMKCHFFLYTIFALILCNYDHTNWLGITEQEDNTFYKKFFNRFYFTSTTYSTAGYGDISPKTIRARIMVMVLQTLILIEIVNLSVHVKPN